MIHYQKLLIGFKAAKALGLRPLFLYAAYRGGIKSGLFRLLTRPGQSRPFPTPIEEGYPAAFPLLLPTPQQLIDISGSEQEEIYLQADEICNGRICLYGQKAVDLNFNHPLPTIHWTQVKEGDGTDFSDIKDIWEPARFGWVFTLGRAYRLSKNENYAKSFWEYFESFQIHNPLHMGANWVSGQEIAIRILAFLSGWQIFFSSPYSTPERCRMLFQAVADHARRIPITLHYARAQGNNHLLTEVAGLYTAGLFFQGSTSGRKWKQLGWKWFHTALQKQISPEGVYCQQSMNYHRLMLHTSLWVYRLARANHDSFPEESLSRLKMATRWLLAQLDLESGQVPNLGGNDGALLLPLSPGSIDDYRPTCQAAGRAFLNMTPFPPGKWDELSLWLGLLDQKTVPLDPQILTSPAVKRINVPNGWATLRAETYTSRPAHADQLHVEIWWKGQNIAMDAGTYRYTAAAPWLNALASTAAHNTLIINDKEQMTRAGRFLWLDWAKARWLNISPDHLSAEHDGYIRMGITHRRSLLSIGDNHWSVKDEVIVAKPKPDKCMIRLHWLLPDFDWIIDENLVKLNAPQGSIQLRITQSVIQEVQPSIRVIRAGQVIYGPPANLPTLGWVSPSYAVKNPALSFLYEVQAVPPITIISDWNLHEGPNPG